MNLISAILFAFSVNIDSFIISLSYGIKHVSISIIQNIFLSLLTTFGTIIALFLGQQISFFFSLEKMQLYGNLFLIFLGSYYLIKPIMPQIFFLLHLNYRLTPDSTSPDSPNAVPLSLRTCILLGLSLSLNNLGIGIGASITGFTLLPATICTLLSSILFLFFGNILGRKYIKNVKNCIGDFLCGIILILLGIADYLPF